MKTVFFLFLLGLPALALSDANRDQEIAQRCQEEGRRAVEFTLTFDPGTGDIQINQTNFECSYSLEKKRLHLIPNRGVQRSLIFFENLKTPIYNNETQSESCYHDPSMSLAESINPLLARTRYARDMAVVASGSAATTFGFYAFFDGPPGWVVGGSMIILGGGTTLIGAGKVKEDAARAQIEEHFKLMLSQFKNIAQTCQPTCVPVQTHTLIFSDSVKDNSEYYGTIQHQVTDLLRDFGIKQDKGLCGADHHDESRQNSKDEDDGLLHFSNGKTGFNVQSY